MIAVAVEEKIVGVVVVAVVVVLVPFVGRGGRSADGRRGCCSDVSVGL